MPAALGTVHSVEVDAPDGAAALELERRLFDLTPAAVYRDGRWHVEVPLVRSIERLEAVLRDWLSDMGARQTCIRVDGRRAETIHVRPPIAHRPIHGDFIG